MSNENLDAIIERYKRELVDFDRSARMTWGSALVADENEDAVATAISKNEPFDILPTQLEMQEPAETQNGGNAGMFGMGTNQTVPQGAVRPNQTVPQEAVRPNQTVPQEAARPNQTVPQEALRPNQTIPQRAVIPNQTVPQGAVLPNQTIPQVEVRPNQTIPQEAARPNQTMPQQAARPNQTTPQEAARPNQTVPQEAARPNQTVPQEAARPNQTVPQEAARPNQTVPQEAARPNQTVPQEAAAPNETMPQSRYNSPADIGPNELSPYTYEQEVEYDSYEQFISMNPKNGTLRVQCFAAEEAIPISNARVIVTCRIGGTDRVFYDRLTDMNGIVYGMLLPAPDKDLSSYPTAMRPYALYNVEVSHPDFINAYFKGVLIFDGIETVQLAQLIPSPPSAEGREETIVFNEGNREG